jgi:hypothetical protein
MSSSGPQVVDALPIAASHALTSEKRFGHRPRILHALAKFDKADFWVRSACRWELLLFPPDDVAKRTGRESSRRVWPQEHH